MTGNSSEDTHPEEHNMQSTLEYLHDQELFKRHALNGAQRAEYLDDQKLLKRHALKGTQHASSLTTKSSSKDKHSKEHILDGTWTLSASSGPETYPWQEEGPDDEELECCDICENLSRCKQTLHPHVLECPYDDPCILYRVGDLAPEHADHDAQPPPPNVQGPAARLASCKT